MVSNGSSRVSEKRETRCEAKGRSVRDERLQRSRATHDAQETRNYLVVFERSGALTRSPTLESE